MTQYLIAYLITAGIFFVIDFIWLGFIAKDFYFSQLGPLMKEKVNIGIAAGFYLMYVVGLVIFAIAPALQSGEWKTALIYGALFGFFCYATYDLTNMSTLKDWPVKMSIVDMIWGAVISGSSTTAGYYLTSLITKS